MRCHTARKVISPLLDGRLTAEERDAALMHIQTCTECSHYLDSLRNLRAMLRRIEDPPVPPTVVRNLHHLVSEEAIRQQPHSIGSNLRQHKSRRLWPDVKSLMRPAALTLAGAIVSAGGVFGLLFPNRSVGGPVGFDPIVALITPPDGTVEGAPGETPGLILRRAALPCDEIIVELTIDQDGLVQNWRMVRGQITQDVKDMIVYSRFIPATYFGQPVQGKVRVALHAADRSSLT